MDYSHGKVLLTGGLNVLELEPLQIFLVQQSLPVIGDFYPGRGTVETLSAATAATAELPLLGEGILQSLLGL